MTSISMSLADLLGGISGGGEEEDAKRPLHEAQIMELAELLKRETSPNPFKVGDLVTPRQNGRYVNPGEPFVVVEVLDTPYRCNSAELGDPDLIAPHDLRVGGLSRSGEYLVWVQRSAELVFYDEGQPINIRDGEPVENNSDEWVKWDGGANPAPGKKVRIKFRNGTEAGASANLLNWNHNGDFDDILSYRIID